MSPFFPFTQGKLNLGHLKPSESKQSRLSRAEKIIIIINRPREKNSPKQLTSDVLFGAS